MFADRCGLCLWQWRVMEDAGTEGNASLSTDWPSASALQAGPAQNAKKVCLRPRLITLLTPQVKVTKWSRSLSWSYSSQQKPN